VAAQCCEFFPGFAAIGGFEHRGVFNAGVCGVGVIERRLDVPHALELPRVLRAVVPHVGGKRRAMWGGCVVGEFVGFALGHAVFALEFFGFAAGRVPGLPAVIGALHDLAEPSAGLGCVDSIGISGGGLHVIDLPTSEMGAVDGPFLALAIGGDDERAFLCADENSNCGHGFLAPCVSEGWLRIQCSRDEIRFGRLTRSHRAPLAPRLPGPLAQPLPRLFIAYALATTNLRFAALKLCLDVQCMNDIIKGGIFWK
jgi:hypothetical protein